MSVAAPISRYLLALGAGALAPLSFSPVELWFCGFAATAGLYYALRGASPSQGARIGWLFGFGLFGMGASWVFVSISVYGNASTLLAGLLTLLLIAALAFLHGLQGWLQQRVFGRDFTLLGFAALWVLGEWLRGWFLTGFPWLYLGYAHVNTPLAGFAPLFGVMGISLVVAFAGAAAVELLVLIRAKRSFRALARSPVAISLLLLWALVFISNRLNWVAPVAERSVEVAMVQANIDQHRKFDLAFLQQNLERYQMLSASLWDAEVVLWPETAIPLLHHQAGGVLEVFANQAMASDASLVSGILYQEGENIHNSIISIGAGEGVYHKQKIVPFGEYVPFRGILGGLLRVFDLPMSSLAPGPAEQDLLRAGEYRISPFICYEVAYPDFVRRRARTADFLATISNDTWFGASWGPLQHLQMAAMRALENGRYMVRATNNGVSAIISEKGEIIARSAQFEAQTLRGEVRLFSGRTPFSRWGSWPLLALCLGVALARCLWRRAA